MTQHKHAPRGPLKTKPQDPMASPDPMKPRCKATNRQGKRCGRWPYPGATVCRNHGGAAPQVIRKADQRLRELEFPAIERIAQLIEQTEFPSVAYQASKDILDRIRGRATEYVEAKVTNITNKSTAELREMALALANQADDDE